ncbi:cob(I)yrinic acid a,c-diamide adenosyltransferase [Candidatus Parcubacteria bacterium]|nr:MAG: cob(I)yrinic acid a,c-diamide adenosyltransferase [Candidatus Parcubacteria bacterium]
MKNSLGKIHIYTGNGKGKTTAALGLALRSQGAGLKVIVLQFLKKGNYSELKPLKKLGVKVLQFGKKDFCYPKAKKSEDFRLAQRGLETAKKILKENFDLVVLDEILVVLKFDLISEREILDLIRCKNKKTEVVLTGRGATKKLQEIADYVTEMKELKHPFSKGIKSRKGIEE